MKQIQPIQFTNEGNMATQLNVILINDNLIDSCNFNWQLFDVNGTLVDTGILLCNSIDYTNWNGDNNYPYTFVYTQLGLVLQSSPA